MGEAPGGGGAEYGMGPWKSLEAGQLPGGSSPVRGGGCFLKSSEKLFKDFGKGIRFAF